MTIMNLATSNVNLHILVMDLGTRHSLLEAKWINIDTSNKEPTLDRRILSQMILHNSLTEFNWVVEFNPDTKLQVVMRLQCQSHADLSCKKGSSLCVFFIKDLIINGRPVWYFRAYNSFVNFTCSSSYQLTNGSTSQKLYCGRDGKWLPPTEQCRG